MYLFKPTKLIFITSLLIVSSTFAAGTNSQVKTTKPYNVILIINDQETYHLATAAGYTLPAREMLAAHGVTFTNHYTAAAMCSPSRAAFLTGTPPQVNGVFDQMEYDFVPSLDPARPTVGSVLKKLGYRTAYFGKFEMDKTLLADKTSINYSTLAKPYGFDEFNPEGDVGGAPQQGFMNDGFYVAEAVQWLRQNQSQTNHSTQPFFMVVSLLNPHDIMYGDANLPNQPLLQKPAVPIILPPPSSKLYQRSWEFQLPVTLTENLSTQGMPSALSAYQEGWSGAYGYIPTDQPAMWRFYYNYYLNSLSDNDNNLLNLMTALNELDMWKNTVVILTADHGEMGGSHGGLRGKGPFAYEENSHIPLIIAAPNGAKHVTCQALTSHLDLLPTVVGLTGLPNTDTQAVTKEFRGHDFSVVLQHPEQANLHSIRPGILFNYVGLSTVDGSYLLKLLEATTGHKPPMPSLSSINLNNRGFLAFVYDGRYKFARYYAPNDFNTPTTFADIFNNNDIQLFDLQNDPNEQHNLALQKEKYQSIILQLNRLLNKLIAEEVGVNSDAFLPAEIKASVKG